MLILSFDVGTRNLSYCLVENEPFRVLQWEVVDTHKEIGHACKTIEDKKRAVLHCLCARREQLLQLAEGDSVVIEQQPFGAGRGSPTMNIIAHTIGAFFLLSHPDATPVFSVRQVSARAKFSIVEGRWGGTWGGTAPAPAALETNDKKRKRQLEHARYKFNKARSVQFCESLFAAQASLESWREMFDGSKKKDDLADALLQALSQIP